MKHVYMPFGNMKRSRLPGTHSRVGGGMGSVLLQTGGPGAGSSYPSLDQYEATTGRNPLARQQRYAKEHTTGSGVESPFIAPPSVHSLGPGLKKKIQALIAKPTKERKPKNISFTL